MLHHQHRAYASTSNYCAAGAYSPQSYLIHSSINANPFPNSMPLIPHLFLSQPPMLINWRGEPPNTMHLGCDPSEQCMSRGHEVSDALTHLRMYIIDDYTDNASLQSERKRTIHSLLEQTMPMASLLLSTTKLTAHKQHLKATQRAPRVEIENQIGG